MPRSWCRFSCSTLLMGVLAVACSKPDAATSSAAPERSEPLPQQMAVPGPLSDSPLFPFVGKCVRAEGAAFGGGKSPPHLLTADGKIPVEPVDGVDAWRKIPGGTTVRVEGMVTGERVLVVERATSTWVGSAERTHEELTSSVGKEVELKGTLISLNDNWWFNTEGVEIHLDGLASLGPLKQHFQPLILKGVITRRPMPRIDQIVLKPNRDLEDAFVLEIKGAAALSATPLVGCDSASAEPE